MNHLYSIPMYVYANKETLNVLEHDPSVFFFFFFLIIWVVGGLVFNSTI